jgi:cysteine-rich repeat protein
MLRCLFHFWAKMALNMNHRNLRCSLIFIGLLVLTPTTSALTDPPLAQLVQVDQGQCQNVPVDEESGQQLVYCCLDEYDLLVKEKHTQEAASFLSALRATAEMTPEEVELFYVSPYQSSIHLKYNITTACGEKIDCALCTPSYRSGNVQKIIESISVCGNGKTEMSEECDNGPENASLPDACRTTCVLPRCGDNIQDSDEECDDGNAINSDGCSSDCKVEPGLTLPVCGDGKKTGDEECDDGNLKNGDGCNNRCKAEAPEPQFQPQATTQTDPKHCGNGIVEKNLGEQCEPSLHDPSLPFSCTNQCRLSSPLCGNKHLDPGEECDAGRANSDAPDGACRTNCSLRRCGDGIPDFDHREECDDGNTDNTDLCSNTCTKNLAVVLPSATQSSVQNPESIRPVASVVAAESSTTSSSGPATLIILAAGAAAGFLVMRVRWRKQ